MSNKYVDKGKEPSKEIQTWLQAKQRRRRHRSGELGESTAAKLMAALEMPHNPNSWAASSIVGHTSMMRRPGYRYNPAINPARAERTAMYDNARLFGVTHILKMRPKLKKNIGSRGSAPRMKDSFFNRHAGGYTSFTNVSHLVSNHDELTMYQRLRGALSLNERTKA